MIATSAQALVASLPAEVTVPQRCTLLPLTVVHHGPTAVGKSERLQMLHDGSRSDDEPDACRVLLMCLSAAGLAGRVVALARSRQRGRAAVCSRR